MNLLPDTFFENRKRLYALLMLAPALVYFRSLFYGFSPMDEQWLIVRDAEYIKNWWNLLNVFNDNIQGIYYRPILLITLIIDAHTGNLQPFTFHLSNILFHLLASLLVFRLLLTLACRQKTAFLLALLFSLHPLSLNAVAWIPGRNDSLICIFILVSLIGLIHYIQLKNKAQLFLHLAFFALALLTKESSVVLPLLYLVTFIALGKPGRHLIWLALCWAGITVAWFILRSSLVHYYPVENAGYLIALKKFTLAFFAFAGKAILPLNQSIAPTLNNSLLAPGLVMALLIALAFYKSAYANPRLAMFGIAMFVLPLLIPVWFGAVSPLGIHDEHRAYTSLVGLLVLVAALKVSGTRPLFDPVLVLFIIAFAAKTSYRLDVYANTANYVKEGAHDCPENFVFHFHSGEIFYKEKKFTEAITAFDKAIALRNNMPQLYHNRANSYVELHQKEKAIADYSKALLLSDYKAEVYLSRCLAYRFFGDIDKCMEDLLAINQKYPGYVKPGLQKEIQRQWTDFAIRQISRMIERQPGSGILYVNRARLYMDKRLNKEALADLKKACELEPANGEFRNYYNELNPSLPR